MWFIGAEVEQETSAPPPKKNPGSAPGTAIVSCFACYSKLQFSNIAFFISQGNRMKEC